MKSMEISFLFDGKHCVVCDFCINDRFLWVIVLVMVDADLFLWHMFALFFSCSNRLWWFVLLLLFSSTFRTRQRDAKNSSKWSTNTRFVFSMRNVWGLKLKPIYWVTNGKVISWGFPVATTNKVSPWNRVCSQMVSCICEFVVVNNLLMMCDC